MRIGLDFMGGDFAPREALQGAVDALEQADLSDVHIVLFGDKSAMADFSNLQGDSHRVSVVHSSEVIEMAEHPTRAISQKRNSSISLGLKMLAEGQLDAFASAGNTGAMMVGSLYTVKAIEGIIRPSLTTLVPKVGGGTGLLLDVGANSDVKPDVLVQFAELGTLYSKHVLKIENPKVGLLSIGHEKEKGNLLTQAAYPLLEESRSINFIGNVEGRDLFLESCDVIVCDGYTGNVVLKTCEGFFYQLKKRGVKDEFLDRFNFTDYGGTAILGVNKPVIIGHGISKSDTFVNMIRLSKRIIQSRLIDKIKSTMN